MKYEVLYSSKTGNTKKVARVIGMTVGSEAKKVKFGSIDADVIFLGSDCYGRKPGRDMQKFIAETEFRDKQIVIFGTYSGRTSAMEWMKKKLEERGARVIDAWSCKGRFLLANRGHPSDEDLAKARLFAEKIKRGIIPSKKAI